MTGLTLNGYWIDAASLPTKLPLACQDWPAAVYAATESFLLDWFDPQIDSITAYTSGSTGKPKKIQLHKKQLLASAAATQNYFNLQAGDKVYLPLSAQFIAGKMMLVRAIVAGLQLYAVPPKIKALDLPEVGQFDFAVMLPQQLAWFIAQEQTGIFKKILLGGAAIPPDLRMQLAALPQPIYHGFGMTETVSHVAMCLLKESEGPLIYQAMPGISLATDERQCLRIKGRVTADRWVQSNDVVQLHDAQRFSWLGRYDFVINSSGVKVMAEALEASLVQLLSKANDRFGCAHTALAVSRQPHPVYGESALLWLACKPLPAEQIDHMLAFFKKELPAGWAPTAIRFANELPVLPNGKLDRMKLEQMA